MKSCWARPYRLEARCQPAPTLFRDSKTATTRIAQLTSLERSLDCSTERTDTKNFFEFARHDNRSFTLLTGWSVPRLSTFDSGAIVVTGGFDFVGTIGIQGIYTSDYCKNEWICKSWVLTHLAMLIRAEIFRKPRPGSSPCSQKIHQMIFAIFG